MHLKHIINLDRGSSSKDWCEPNYEIIPTVAEFYNTISNVVFIIPAVILSILFHKSYVGKLSCKCHLVWISMVVMGIGSAYYHATLNLFGQLWDEAGILWVTMATFGLFTPTHYLPNYMKKRRSTFQITIFFCLLLQMFLLTVYPVINKFAFTIYGIPVFYMLVKESKQTSNQDAKLIGWQAFSTWIIAIFCWVFDQVSCGFLLSTGIKYLHALWHIFAAIAAVRCIVLLAYYEALYDNGNKFQVKLLSWPKFISTKNYLCIPYVSIENCIE